MKRQSVPLSATANTRSDQPLIIDGDRTTSGDLAINTTSNNAITVKTTSHWEHQDSINASGAQTGLITEPRAVILIKGNTTLHGKQYNGLYLDSHAELTVNQNLKATAGNGSTSTQRGAYINKYAKVLIKGKVTLVGERKSASYGEGLSIQEKAEWISEGRLTAEGKTAIQVAGGHLQQQQDAVLQGSRGLDLQGGSATIQGKLTVQGEDHEAIRLTQQAKLTLEGPLEAKAWENGIAVDNSQLTLVGESAIQSIGEKPGIEVKNNGQVTINASTNISSKAGRAINLLSNAAWQSNQPLNLDSPNNTGLAIDENSKFTHHGNLKSKGRSGFYLYSGGVTVKSESHDTPNEIMAVGRDKYAVYLAEATFSHQGSLSLHSQGSGIRLTKSTSQWASIGQLTLKTPAAVVITLEGGKFSHQGPFTVNDGHTLSLTGSEPAVELRDVVTMHPGSQLDLQVEQPLTINGMQLENTSNSLIWPSVTLSSPQLTVNGVVNINSYGSGYKNGGHVELRGGGLLQLEKLLCSPGSSFTVSGDFDIRIGEVICRDGGTAQLAFRLSNGNSLSIGHFELPKKQAGKPPALSMELTGNDLQLSFDVGDRMLNQFPQGIHYCYRASSQQAPVQLITQLENPHLEMPSTALLTQMLATDSCIGAGATISEIYYTPVGQSLPVALVTDPQNSITLPSIASGRFSNHPPLI